MRSADFSRLSFLAVRDTIVAGVILIDGVGLAGLMTSCAVLRLVATSVVGTTLLAASELLFAGFLFVSVLFFLPFTVAAGRSGATAG